MTSFLKLASWVALLCLAVVGVGSWIPAEKTGASSVQRGPIGETPEELVKAGKAIFFGADSCSVCHALEPGVPNKRCPVNMKDVFNRAASRAEEIRQTRDPSMTPIQYLVESVHDPDAYIVQDEALGGPFGKGVMKPVDGPPLALSEQQIKAVLAFLISSSGQEVTGDVVATLDAAQAPWRGKSVALSAAAGLKIPEGDGEEGRYAFEEMKCWQCHKIDGEEFGDNPDDTGGVGPNLTGIGGIQTQEYLMESILNPSAVVVAGEGFAADDGESKMPEYHDTMTLREMVDLVAYLKSLKSTGSE